MSAKLRRRLEQLEAAVSAVVNRPDWHALARERAAAQAAMWRRVGETVGALLAYVRGEADDLPPRADDDDDPARAAVLARLNADMDAARRRLLGAAGLGDDEIEAYGRLSLADIRRAYADNQTRMDDDD